MLCRMLRKTAIRAAFCDSDRSGSARMATSTCGGEPLPLPLSSSRPAWARRVSADRLSAVAIDFSTLTEGWCRPRSNWLR